VVLAVAAVAATIPAATRRTAPPTGPELAALFGDQAGAEPGPKARLWALGVLFDAGVDPDSDRSYATRVLRQAEPRLSARAARALVDALA